MKLNIENYENSEELKDIVPLIRLSTIFESPFKEGWLIFRFGNKTYGDKEFFCLEIFSRGTIDSIIRLNHNISL